MDAAAQLWPPSSHLAQSSETARGTHPRTAKGRQIQRHGIQIPRYRCKYRHRQTQTQTYRHGLCLLPARPVPTPITLCSASVLLCSCPLLSCRVSGEKWLLSNLNSSLDRVRLGLIGERSCSMGPMKNGKSGYAPQMGRSPGAVKPTDRKNWKIDIDIDIDRARKE